MIYGGSRPGQCMICDINTPRWPSRRLVQLFVCQVRSRINDVCHLAVVNVSILTTNHVFFFSSVFQKMTESN